MPPHGGSLMAAIAFLGVSFNSALGQPAIGPRPGTCLPSPILALVFPSPLRRQVSSVLTSSGPESSTHEWESQLLKHIISVVFARVNL